MTPDNDRSKGSVEVTLERAGQKLVQIGTVRVTFQVSVWTGLITGNAHDARFDRL